MTALTLQTAENTGLGVAAGLIALMVLMAIIVKNITAKILSILIIGGFAFGVWTQRSSLQDCADKLRAPGALTNSGHVTCKFLGSEVTISTPAIS